VTELGVVFLFFFSWFLQVPSNYFCSFQILILKCPDAVVGVSDERMKELHEKLYSLSAQVLDDCKARSLV
jgi:hypothetical protein